MVESSRPAVGLAVDLVNSYALDPTVRDPEYLREPADLDEILRRNGLTCPRPTTAADVRAAWSVRRRLRRVFESGPAADRVAVLDALARGAIVEMRLDGDRVQRSLVAPRSSFARWLSVRSSLGLASFLETYGLGRLGVCEASPCRDVYADASFNRSRRYCSDRCSNRFHAAAHRRRLGSARGMRPGARHGRSS